ncbi:alkaline phosphatase family protein [Actinoplanes subtropicus]|uniref:alkaline phosphatase family protein n=1 Tax=Actinoplanes subtropicus TaxID=543632 RepID=UPI0004C41997|nr:alkaline phosphatase family protein [Actinoplanes subtropicus]
MIRPAVAGLAVLGLLAAAPADAAPSKAHPPNASHVLLLSIDGLHQQDLDWYVRTHPQSTLARLTASGTRYRNAATPYPSDSFPGMLAQVTGGDPRTTGVYYDDTWNAALLPAGTTKCAGVQPGAEVDYAEPADRDSSRLDAGQGLAGLPGSILSLTGSPEELLDPAQLPVDPATCTPVYPHQYLKVNTVFEVARRHGLVTAWSDKHPAYDVLQGPSGAGIQDLFTPEINSTADAAGDDWTKVNRLTQQYDGYKVQAVLNQIDGYDHSRSIKLGTPAVFGMNFQSVSTAQKLPTSDGQAGGYLADGRTPGPVLAGALDFVDAQVGRFTAELAKQRLAGRTTVIVSAKHGQSPTDPAQLTRIDDGAIIDGLNAAWKAAGHSGNLVAFSVDDDTMLIWLTDRSPAATAFARSFLLGHSGTGNGITGAAKPYTSSGLSKVYAGAAAAAFIGVPAGDARVPDLIGIAQPGVVYTAKKSKIAEHGGDAPADRHVPIVVSGPGAGRRTVDAPVETTQIAPTILRLLGLDPRELAAVRIQHTAPLPG